VFINHTALYKMLNSDFQVDKPSDAEMQNYWNWLLGQDPDHHNPINGVFYMRACYGYINEIQNLMSPNPQRKNLCDNHPNTVGSESNPISIANNVPIIIPLLDTVVTDHDLVNGTPSSTLMNNILDGENDQVGSSDLSAKIANLTAQTSLHDIDENLMQFRTTSPSTSDSDMFPLTIDTNSTLADRVEFAIPKGVTVQARLQGFYLKLHDIAPSNEYYIKIRCHGVRKYKAFMDYYIYVQ
jgi:hypothetical protein